MPTQNVTDRIGAPVAGRALREVENEIASGSDDMVATYTVDSDCVIDDFCYYQPSGGTTTVKKRVQGTSGRDVPLLTQSSGTGGAALAGTRLVQGDVVVVTHDTTSGRKGHQLLLGKVGQ